MDWIDSFNQGKIADALATLKNQVQPSVTCITLRYNQQAPSWAQKRETRIAQCEILAQTPAGIVINENGTARVLKPTELESPQVFTFFNDKWYGDCAIYELYTQNTELRIEALHADFKRILADKFAFFNACINEPLPESDVLINLDNPRTEPPLPKNVQRAAETLRELEKLEKEADADLPF